MCCLSPLLKILWNARGNSNRTTHPHLGLHAVLYFALMSVPLPGNRKICLLRMGIGSSSNVFMYCLVYYHSSIVIFYSHTFIIKIKCCFFIHTAFRLICIKLFEAHFVNEPACLRFRLKRKGLFLFMIKPPFLKDGVMPHL